MKGIGIDLIEIDRVKKSLDRHGNHFLNRLFSIKEQDYCLKFKDPSPHLAGRFAAKEAIVKALGVGFGAKIRWSDIEILNDTEGKPIVSFSSHIIDQFGHPKVMISISHSENYATAVAIWS
jgi:holo-[acyl-carrier protein] synthase